jgi:hypothetical protein
MSQADALEAALAEIERTLDEHDQTLQALFSRGEELGSASVLVDERELADLVRPREPSAPRGIQPTVLGARC